MTSFKKNLKQLKRKILLENVMKNMFYGLIAGSLLSACFIAVSKFIFFYYMLEITLILFLAPILISFVFSLFTAPDYRNVAIAADALGYKERFITAYEILNRKDDLNQFEKLVVFDADNQAKREKLSKKYKLRIRKRLGVTALCLLVLPVLAGFAPSPKFTDAEILAQRELHEKISEEVKKIDEKYKEIAKEISKKNAKEVQKEIDKLKKDLKSVKNEAEAVRAMQKAQQEIKQIEKNAMDKDLKAIGDVLSQNELTKELGEALKNNDTNKIKKESEELAESLKTASQEQLDELAEMYKQLAEAIKENPELAQAFNDLNRQIQNGNFNDLSQSMQELGQTLENMAQQNESLRSSLEELNQSLTESSQSMSPSQQNSSQQNSSQQNTGQQNSGQQGEEGQEGQRGEQGESGQQGQRQQGQSQSQGQGQGQGQTQTQSQGGQTGQQGGTGDGTGHIANDPVYSRKAEGYDEFEANLNGTETNQGTYNEIEQKGTAPNGEIKPYSEVYTEYRNEALKSLEDNDIPHGMQEIVIKYFSTLE